MSCLHPESPERSRTNGRRASAPDRARPIILAADHDAEKEPEPERDAERRHRVAPDRGLDGGYRFARLVLSALDLMLTAALELAGKALDVTARVSRCFVPASAGTPSRFFAG
jgi:hypothetical protein